MQLLKKIYTNCRFVFGCRVCVSVLKGFHICLYLLTFLTSHNQCSSLFFLNKVILYTRIQNEGITPSLFSPRLCPFLSPPQLPLPLGLDCAALTSARPPLPPRPPAMASRIGLRMQVQHNCPPLFMHRDSLAIDIKVVLCC